MGHVHNVEDMETVMFSRVAKFMMIDTSPLLKSRNR